MLGCPCIWSPICGTDGEIHANECVMRSKACEDNKWIEAQAMMNCAQEGEENSADDSNSFVPV